MKLNKKTLGLLLAAVMVLTVCASAMAIGGGSITVLNAQPGETYKAYQILYIETYNETAGTYTYKANAEWKDWLKSSASDYVAVDDADYVTWINTDATNDGEAINAFVKAARAQLSGKTVAASGTNSGDTEQEITLTPTGGDSLQLGYYLVDSTVGTICSLDTTHTNMRIEDKNELPGIEKKVGEDSTGDGAANKSEIAYDRDDADIGQTVYFKTTVTAKVGAKNLVVHDDMSAGLTLDFDSVSISGLTKFTAEGSPWDYKVETPSDECDFHVVFNQTYLDTIRDDTSLVITYNATLNENAKIGEDEGNPNKTKLDYGENGHTEWDETITYTWSLKAFKFYLDGTNKEPLANVEFTLSKSGDGSDPIQMIETTAGNYRVAKSGETGTTTLKTGTDGMLNIVGLDADVYYLTEINPPDGYNKLAGPIKVEITHNDSSVSTKYEAPTIKYSAPGGTELEYDPTDNGIEIENKSGSLLPSTGGMGTTILYVIGGLLVVAAAVLLVTKKRTDNEK